MRILVTGAAGFIGARLIPKLLALGYDVCGLDTRQGYAVGRLDHTFPVTLVAADMTENVLQDAIPGPIDYVVHLAAIGAPRVCDENPALAFNVNVNGTHNVLKLALQRGASKFIFASTAHVYGISPKYMPTDERHPLWMQDTYTTTKILGEQLCQLFYDNHGLPYTTIRLFNGYGPGQAEGYFIPDMMKKAKTGRIELRGGDVTKDFVYVSDVVEAYAAALETEYNGPLNIGTGIETPLETVAAYIAHKFDAELVKAEEDYRPGGPTRMRCDPSRAKKVLGWEPTISMDDGLDRTFSPEQA